MGKWAPDYDERALIKRVARTSRASSPLIKRLRRHRWRVVLMPLARACWVLFPTLLLSALALAGSGLELAGQILSGISGGLFYLAFFLTMSKSSRAYVQGLLVLRSLAATRRLVGIKRVRAQMQSVRRLHALAKYVRQSYPADHWAIPGQYMGRALQRQGVKGAAAIRSFVPVIFDGSDGDLMELERDIVRLLLRMDGDDWYAIKRLSRGESDIPVRWVSSIKWETFLAWGVALATIGGVLVAIYQASNPAGSTNP